MLARHLNYFNMENMFILRSGGMKKVFKLAVVLILISGPLITFSQSVKLYTPYTRISVPPGESIDYTVDVINDSQVIKNVPISIRGLTEDWTYSLIASGITVNQISVLPGESEEFELKVNVPFEVEKGIYRFGVSAGSLGYLPLVVVVSEKGTAKTEFTSEQPNMEGHTGSNYTFNAEIRNSTGKEQLYALRGRAPRGWVVTFKANYKQATSINIAPNVTERITVEVNPPDYLPADTYVIPVEARTSTSVGTLDLEVVITGSYDIELASPTGLLSTKLTAGSQKRVDLLVKNSGSTALEDVKLVSMKPKDWEVVFEPKEIDRIETGQVAQISASIKAPDKSIPGDYAINMEARTPEVSARVAFRASVETSVLAGWVGILIILGVIGLVIYLFRKYGRR